jgi:hypothetical protein
VVITTSPGFCSVPISLFASQEVKERRRDCKNRRQYFGREARLVTTDIQSIIDLVIAEPAIVLILHHVFPQEEQTDLVNALILSKHDV